MRHGAGSKPVPRILHLIDVAGTGGAETVFCQMVRYFARRGQNALVVLPESGWIAEQLDETDGDVRIVASGGSFSMHLLGMLVRLSRSSGATVLLAHLLGSATYAAAAGLVLRRPVIAIFHGALDFAEPGSLAGIKRWLLGRDHVQVVAVSNGVRDALVSWGLASERVLVIGNGVDTARFHPVSERPLRRELGVPDHALIIGSVGNLHPVKGYELLLQAAALLAREEEDLYFVVAGEGDPLYRQSLEKLRDQLGLQSRFLFLGFRTTDPGHYCSLDLFVSSASSEGLPLTFLEAMACGIPIVATENEGSGSLVRETGCGVTVPYADPHGLAAAMKRLLRDRSIARAYGDKGMQAVRRDYSLDATLARYGQLVEQACCRDERDHR